eukprot:6196538-Pleurochrysis_carterae.AAC.2
MDRRDRRIRHTDASTSQANLSALLKKRNVATRICLHTLLRSACSRTVCVSLSNQIKNCKCWLHLVSARRDLGRRRRRAVTDRGGAPEVM